MIRPARVQGEGAAQDVARGAAQTIARGRRRGRRDRRARRRIDRGSVGVQRGGRRARDRRLPGAGHLRRRARDRRDHRRLRRRPPRADAIGGRRDAWWRGATNSSRGSTATASGSTPHSTGGCSARGRACTRSTAAAAWRGAGELALRGRHVGELGQQLRRALTDRAARDAPPGRRGRSLARTTRAPPGRDGQRLGSRTRALDAALERRRQREARPFRRRWPGGCILSPLAVLGRGYAVCWDGARTHVIRPPPTSPRATPCA